MAAEKPLEKRAVGRDSGRGTKAEGKGLRSVGMFDFVFKEGGWYVFLGMVVFLRL